MTRLAILAVVAGCALTSKTTPAAIRYFAPPEAAVVHHATTGSPIRLRIGRLEPSAVLGYAIVRRASPVEVVPYETLRWTERPEDYVRRAIVRAMFDARGVEQSVAGDANTLDVEVLAFEEVQRGSRHFGRVELRYALHDRERVIARGTSAAEVPAADPAIETVVAAIGTALARASAQLADQVVGASGPQR